MDQLLSLRSGIALSLVALCTGVGVTGLGAQELPPNHPPLFDEGDLPRACFVATLHEGSVEDGGWREAQPSDRFFLQISLIPDRHPLPTPPEAEGDDGPRWLSARGSFPGRAPTLVAVWREDEVFWNARLAPEGEGLLVGPATRVEMGEHGEDPSTMPTHVAFVLAAAVRPCPAG